MIQIKNLKKNYGRKEAVRGISFGIKKGEIVGFLGPNGAGKSTTMNIVTGYLSATDGSVSIAGFDVLDDAIEARRHIGYLPEQPPLYFDMTVDEYLNFVFELKKVEGAREAHLARICELVGIGHVRHRIIRNLSKGYRQRVGLAQALVGDPDVLILDEPTVGLDPNQIVEIRNLIKGLGRDKTVVLSTHIIPEVSAVCERVIVINDGLIVADDTVENLLHNIGEEQRFAARIEGSPDRILTAVRKVDGVIDIFRKGASEGAEIHLSDDGEAGDYIITASKETDIRKPVFYALAEADCPLLSFAPVDISLEAVFGRLTRKDKEDAQ